MHPVKRIRLTIEWAGACGEASWAVRLMDVIEEADRSRVTRVSDVELLTDHGTTTPDPGKRVTGVWDRFRAWRHYRRLMRRARRGDLWTSEPGA